MSGIAPGSHVLYIYAQSSATGQWDHTTVPVTVTSAGAGNTTASTSATAATGVTNANAVVKITAPQGNAALTGPTQVRGYALDCSTGTPASTVRVYAGTNTSGQPLGTTTVGSSQADLGSACAGRGLTGASNAGFGFNLDPSMLGGVNAITIAADTTAGPATTTLTFGGGAPSTTNTAGTPTNTGCTNNTSAMSPFAVACGQPTTATIQNAQNTQYANQGNCPQGMVWSNTGGNNPYMNQSQAYNGGQQTTSGTCVPANASVQNTGYPSQQMYNNNTAGYNYNPYNTTNYNTNGYNYNTGYNQQYPYNTNQYGYNGYQNGYQYNNYGYNNGYQYNPGGVSYSNNTPYGYPYNTSYLNNNGSYYNNNTYGYPYGYNGYNYNNGYNNGYNTGYPYNNGAYGAPYGYQSPYIYNGNAGSNYGNPYGYPGGYGNPYGNPYGYPY